MFPQITDDLRRLLRELGGKEPEPTAVIFDRRTLRSPPGNRGDQAGSSGGDEHKKKHGGKLYPAVDTFGHLLALTVTPANEDGRKQAGKLARQVQEATDRQVELAYVDQGYAGDKAADAAQEHGIKLEVVKLPYAKRGFALLSRRWVVERSFAWASRFRGPVKDYQRLPDTPAGLHVAAFIIPILAQLANAMQESTQQTLSPRSSEAT